MRNPKSSFGNFSNRTNINDGLYTDIYNSEFWFLQSWVPSFIPVCMEDSKNAPKDCFDFKPAFSDQGICFTRNAAPMEQIYKSTRYIQSFEKTFQFNKRSLAIKPNKGSGFQNLYSFIVDNGNYGELKRGMKIGNLGKDKTYRLGGMESPQAEFLISIHSPHDVADTVSNGIKVQSGYETTIRVNLLEYHSTESVKGLHIDKRKCLFSDEHENSMLFLHYSKVNCEIECKLDYAERSCGCRPWNYPRPFKHHQKDSENPICNFFSSSCFHSVIKYEQVEKFCFENCFASCNEVKYTISTERVPLSFNEEMCTPLSKEIGNPSKTTKASKSIKRSIWNHIFRLPHVGNSNINANIILYLGQKNPKKYRWFKQTSTYNISKMVYDSLMNETLTDKEYCIQKLMNDIAIVNVIVNSQSVVKLIQSVRVTFSDMLANIGR